MRPLKGTMCEKDTAGKVGPAASRAYGALRVVASRREIDKDPILKRVAGMSASSDKS